MSFSASANILRGKAMFRGSYKYAFLFVVRKFVDQGKWVHSGYTQWTWSTATFSENILLPRLRHGVCEVEELQGTD